MANSKVKLQIAALLCVAISCACTREGREGDALQRISAGLSDAVPTKVTLSQPQSGLGLALAWQNGDCLRVFGGSTSSVFNIVSGFTAHQASFEGTPVQGQTFDIIYPGTFETMEQINARSYVGQVQNDNASTAHLQWNAKVEGSADYSVVDFSKGKRSGVLAVSMMLPESVTRVDSLTITASAPIFYLSNDAEAEKGDKLRLDFENTAPGTNGELQSYLMTSWNDVDMPASTQLTIIIYTNDERLTKKLSVPAGGLVMKGGAVNVIRLNGDLDGSNVTGGLEGFIWNDNSFWN